MLPTMNAQFAPQGVTDSEIGSANQESSMWLDPVNMRYGLFADMDLEMTLDANPTSWNYGTL